MIREYISSTLQSKNAVMFIASVMFMAGILSYFNNCGIILSVIFTLIGIFLILGKYTNIKYILFFIIIFYIGFFNTYFRTNLTDNLYKIAPANKEVTGQIVSIPHTTNNKTKFFLRIDSVDGQKIKNAKTYITLDEGKYNMGDFIKLEAKIRRPIKAGNPSQFDYGKYLKNYNTYTTAYADTAQIMDIDLPIQWKFIKHLNKIRNNILDTHSKYLKSPNLEILGGIVFGDDAIAPPDYIKSTFVNSGLLHILAASGMNVAFIFGFWFLIMRLLKVPYKINVLGGMIMVILYTLMTGLGASVLRAALMLLFIQIGKLIDRDAHSVSLLSFVAMLLLIYNPAYINDVGFQLSFIVTFGLLTTGKVIFDKIQNIKIPEWLKGALIIPVVAQLWVIPIQIFYFNTISTYSVLANILTVPFLSVISFGGFISSILATITPVADFVCRIFDFVLKYMLDIVVIISNYFSQLPYALIQTSHPGIIQEFIYYVILGFITILIAKGINKKNIITICSLIALLFVTSIPIPNHNLELIFFDVQNADAFLIKTPDNRYFIIDTAKLSYTSKNSTARLVISKYLKDRGIKNIEGLILTHFDLDHAGGAADLMEDLKIKTVYVNTFNKTNYTIYKIFDTIKEKKINTVLAQNNSTIYDEKDLKIKLYKSGITKNDNENSIITLLSYKNFDILFMGDAGILAFNKIKKDIPHNVEVFKVGHHGGKDVVNYNMLKHLNSHISIISTGPNPFGHPNKNTLEILQETEVYRTDTDNSIKITTDGNKYKVYRFDTYNKKYQMINEYLAK